MIALVLLLMTGVYNLESVVGVLRDGAVHHESGADAIAHTRQHTGDHGHEDLATTGSHHHGKGHEHGTASDHCTHQHGAALLPSFSFEMVDAVTHLDFVVGQGHSEPVPQTFVHPPRA